MFSEKAYRYLVLPPKRFNLLHGSVRSSKTTNALCAVPDRVLNAPKGDIVFTGKTERTAYRNIVRNLQEMFGTARVKYNKGMAEGSIAGRTFYVIGGNNEQAVTKAQGLTVAYWGADEATTYPSSFVDMMVTRLSPEGACSDWTMNPAGPYHPVKVDFIDRAEELKNDLRVWHFTLPDNPNLDPSYVEMLRSMYPPGSLFSQRYIDGLWVFAEGAVYDFFDRDLHRLDFDLTKVHEPDYWSLAGDYGTGNATSIAVYAHWHVPRFENLRVLRHRAYYYDSQASGRQKTDPEQVADVEEHFGGFKELGKRDPRTGTRDRAVFYLDPSAASFKALLQQAGWQVYNAKNDVVDGIRTVARLLKDGEYKLGPHESNDQAERDYAAYLWDKKAQERGEDKPLKGEGDGSHTADEQRYALHSQYRVVAPLRRKGGSRVH